MDGGHSSMGIIVEWLRKPENYGKWKGGDENNGENKETLCSQIRDILIENGINHRTNRDIRNRIKYIHDKFRECCDWLSQTGQGILDKAETEGVSEEETLTTIKGI